jgi:hypothetical protein
MAIDTKDFVTDSFKQAAETFARTMQTGIRFQEETARFWSDFFGKQTEEARHTYEKLTTDALPFSQKNVERFHRMFDDQATKSISFLKKAFEHGPATTATETYERMLALWQQSFDTLRESADAVAKANGEMFDNYSNMVRTFSNGGSKPVVTKPASAK